MGKDEVVKYKNKAQQYGTEAPHLQGICSAGAKALPLSFKQTKCKNELKRTLYQKYSVLRV